MDLTADTDSLRADGVGLQATTAMPAGGAPRCPPAAADPVSGSVAQAFSHWSQVLWTLMEHAGHQRETGGISVAAVAQHLDQVDTASAGAISAVLGGSSLGSGADNFAGPTSAGPVAPPTLPPLPQMVAPPPMTGEQVAAMVHSQPNPDHLRMFADHWRSVVGPRIVAAADETRSYGNSIAHDWDDGDPAAARNVLKHADWLESALHGHVTNLAASAEEAAGHADTLIQNTPRPEEFRDLRQRLNTAMRTYRASGGVNGGEVIALNNELGQKNETALASYSTYAAAAPTTTTGAGQPPPPAPAIVDSPSIAPVNGSPALVHPKTGGAHGKGGDGTDNDGAGGTTIEPGQADSGPVGPSGTVPAAPAPPPGTNGAQSPVGSVAGIAGQIMGAGMGAIGQVGNSLRGLSGGGSPLSALSSLSSLGGMPHSGSPQSPDSGDQGGDSTPDPGADQDFGSGGTTPAGGGDGGGAPMSSASPAVSASPMGASGPTVGTPSVAAPASGAGGMGGSGMFAPPMMGGMGRGGEEGRTSKERRRVVMRPVDNSEPVFGEMERRRSARRQTQSARKDDDDDVKESR
jgi:hypothetical protein